MPYVLRDGQKVVYEALGSGRETVVLAHNLMAQRGTFAAVAGSLARRVRVLAIDLRGHGESVPTARAFTLPELAGDLAAVLDAEGVGRALIVGTSLGASAAAWLAIHEPARVRGLVLISMNAGAASVVDRLRFAGLAALLRGLGPGPVMPLIVGELLGASYRRQPGAVAAAERWIRATPRRELMRAVQAWAGRPGLVGSLGAIVVPTVVVAGAEDRACPRGAMVAVAAEVPGATLEVIAGAGHTVQLEQPAALCAVIEALLDRLAG